MKLKFSGKDAAKLHDICVQQLVETAKSADPNIAYVVYGSFLAKYFTDAKLNSKITEYKVR
jgi:hypothetical protein